MKCCLNLPAPAKLNLFLHVVGRKPDGMHLLESVFNMIDLCDYLDFEVLDGRCQAIYFIFQFGIALCFC